MRSLDAEVGHELRDRFGPHWRTSIGVNRQACRIHLVLMERLLDKAFGQRGRFSPRQQPAHHVPTVEIEDHIEIEPRAARASNLRDVPRPDLVDAFGSADWRGMLRMRSLRPPLT